MNRILGVDPGSNCTGYGLVVEQGGNVHYELSGFIRPQRSLPRHERIREIFVALGRVIEECSPTQFAIEDVFHAKNVRSMLALGEARGAAILAATLAGLPVFEYAPRDVKLAVTGNGAAHKSQVNFMLGKILSLSPAPENADESDAIAIAMCHAFRSNQWSPA
jgi:crossover junction endodeoxyribonuclease RuvC